MNITSSNVSKSFQLTDGLRVPSHFDIDIFGSGLTYKAQPDDIFIATYPKCGTTWMETIVFGLMNNGEAFDQDIGNYLMRTPHLERVGKDNISTIPRPYSIKTHLPFERIPFHPQAKYICVIRNPKDVCVSLYHFLVKHSQSYYLNCPFDEFFIDCLTGQLPYGDYFEYLRSLYSYKEYENVLIISYEQMKHDIRSVIRRLAQFLNINLIKQDELLQRVVDFSSFEYMKKNFDKARNNFFAQITADPIAVRVPSTYIRNGAIGDWKTCMSKEQNEEFDKKLFDEMRVMPDFERLWN